MRKKLIFLSKTCWKEGKMLEKLIKNEISLGNPEKARKIA
jgi:hypothetical protein